MLSRRKKARAAAKAARVAGKAAKSGATRSVARGAGKAALKGGRALSSGEPAGSRFLKYGFFALAGFVAGALVARMGEKEVSTWGTGSDPAAPRRPEAPSRTGTEREYSDPTSGPLIGRHHQPVGDVPEQQEEVENRIRTRVGEDPRTLGLERLNVEVNDGVAEIWGIAPSDDAKEAVSEIASGTEGVREVRNLMSVNP